jgi:hypothetical protein
MKEEMLKEYYDSCDKLLKLFCNKHDLEYDNHYWIGNDVGGIVDVNDMFFGM